jgi:hypothetical protein
MGGVAQTNISVASSMPETWTATFRVMVAAERDEELRDLFHGLVLHPWALPTGWVVGLTQNDWHPTQPRHFAVNRLSVRLLVCATDALHECDEMPLACRRYAIRRSAHTRSTTVVGYRRIHSRL